jgi:uncharacterized protein YcbX
MEVRELWRWPVEGTTGESTPSVRVDVRGIGGDRVHAILAEGPDGWAPATPERLAGWRSSYPFAIGAALDPAKPPYAVLTAPGGRQYQWGDPRLRTALQDHLGVPVRLERQAESARTVTITTTAQGSDAAALRTNLHLDAGDVRWLPGTELHFPGGARLRVLAPLAGGGARARVVANGRVAVGEPAELPGS